MEAQAITKLMYSLGWNHNKINEVSSRLYPHVYFNLQTVKFQLIRPMALWYHLKDTLKIAQGLDSHPLEELF